MKRLIALLAVFSIAFTACKNKEQKTEPKKIEKEEVKNAYNLSEATNVITFTAYKTTDKVGVAGNFTEIKITKGGISDNLKGAISGAEFSIPVSSIETKDDSRNMKIRKFFFGIMKDTELLSGKFILEDDKTGYIDLKMNGITKKLPFTYTTDDKTFTLRATMNISDWDGQTALESLNKACFDLHKGADGKSKTWDDVAIEATATFK